MSAKGCYRCAGLAECQCRHDEHALAGNLGQYHPGDHAVLVLDGAGWHQPEALNVPGNITLLTLPPYSPELNPVENVWAYIRANKLAISVFDTVEDILDACCDAWNFFANDKEAV